MKKYSVGIQIIYLNREGGVGSELDKITDTFKTISRHKLVDTNLAPTKKVYRGVT